ncbi:hypothetical protein H4Q32_024100 [Labeo rohita]|uniref:Uncharacterized protein n=1 Tax=Labeo rohita TaxID=84645 RepID=A0ABQ8L4F7_LABRO|nr:hypothetical protein H4Q32_024100 [Labeo rohita]
MSSFNSHISRKHRNCSVNSISDSHRPSASVIPSVSTEQCSADLDPNTDQSVIKGTLCCIAEENLGSHCIDGFTENCSQLSYFCRYKRTLKCANLDSHLALVMTFLKRLPVILGDRVLTPADEVWQLTLQLKDIGRTRTILADLCSENVAYFDVLIQEYLESRKAAFPEVNLKPKHHYLQYCPGLIFKFDPLIRLWIRHQLFQAYLTSGSCPPVLQLKDSSPFNSELYSETVKEAVSQFNCSERETRVSLEIQYEGTVFKKG